MNSENRYQVPLLARLLLAPFYWPKLIGGARFQPLEREVFGALLEALPQRLSQVAGAQLNEVNYIQRMHEKTTEVILYKLGLIGPSKRREQRFAGDGEARIANVSLQLSNHSVSAEIWTVDGIVHSIEFDGVVELRRRAERVDCEPDPAWLQAQGEILNP